MKKTFFALFLIVLAGLVLAQSAAQIGDIRGRKNKPIRTAFEAIATGTKTVSGAWTVSGDWVISGEWAFSDTTDFSIIAVSDSAFADTLVSNMSTFDTAIVTDSLHADTLNVNTMTIGTGGALINPNHADTLSIEETYINLNGGVTIGSDPAIKITAIDTFGASGKWLKITAAGVTFWAIADTSVIP